MSTDKNLKWCLLLCTFSENNNNKFYLMEELDDGRFMATYGRIGDEEISRESLSGLHKPKYYPMSKWDSTYKSKTKSSKKPKPYEDVTDLMVKVESGEFAKIDNTNISKIMELLNKYSYDKIVETYSSTFASITQKRVDKAEELLNKLSLELSNNNLNTSELNSILDSYYTTIPRKMKNTKDHCFKDLSKDDNKKIAKELLENEFDTLNNLKTQLSLTQTIDDDKESNRKHTILDILGIEVRECTNDELSTIKKLMINHKPNGRKDSDDSNRLVEAYAVVNKKTQHQFDKWVKAATNKNIKLMWHGSRNENWISILKTGLQLNPSKAKISGKMFGHGTYFADNFRKSANYSSVRGSYWTKGTSKDGFLALYDVHVGKQLHIKHHNSSCYSLSQQILQHKGNYDSVFAQGGADLRNNEFIVYNENQTTIKFIVRVK